jgi:putative Holliday junction resolvase
LDKRVVRALGLDVGDVRIGVAVSDSLGWTAQALKVITRAELAKDLAEIKQIIGEYDVEELVVGLPKNMDGTLGSRAEKTMAFVDELKSEIDLPIVLWDERLSTVSATKALLEADLSRRKRKEVVDKIAAVIILQGYLDAKR